MKIALLLFLLFFFSTAKAQTVTIEHQEKIKPSIVFLKSLVMPGWGHLSLGMQHQNRGYIHLGAEIGLLLSYFGIDARTSRLQNNLYAFVEINAETSIKNRDRSYALAIARFENLQSYNEFQERSRNWNAFIADTPQNRWQWSSVEAQANYIRMRNEIDANNQQLPFIATAMVANRIISGISAFIRVREMENTSLSSLNIQPVFVGEIAQGLQLSWQIEF
jgi:hypothetical protein